MKPAGKQATHIGAAGTAPVPPATQANAATSAAGRRLTVTVVVVFTNAYEVTVEETTKRFLLA